MQAQESKIEMVYGIYFAESADGFNGPVGERQAGCVIGEGDSDKEILHGLYASDFLNSNFEYEVVDWTCSIHINYKGGGVVLVLLYEEDL